MDGEVLARPWSFGANGLNRLRRYVSKRYTTNHTFFGMQCQVCVLVNANVYASTKSDIKLESLILAQNERVRQA